MMKYIKDLFMPNSKKNSYLKEALSYCISFREKEKSLILRNCAEHSIYDQAKYKKSCIESCNEKLNNTRISFLNLFAQLRGIRSENINPEDCKSLNRLNSVSPLSSLFVRVVSLKTFLIWRKCDAVQQVKIDAKGEMQPIPLSKTAQQCLYKDNDICNVLRNLMKQRQLKEGRAKPTLKETTATKSSRNIKVLDKKGVINIDIQNEENRIRKPAGIINIDDILKKEDSNRKARVDVVNWRLDRSKVPAEEINYLRNFVELNRILDRKIMNSKEKKPTNPTKIVEKKEPK